jgi:hypothetical protein
VPQGIHAETGSGVAGSRHSRPRAWRIKKVAANQLETRRALYFRLSREIAHIDNTQLRALLDKSEGQSGWGRNHALTIAGSRVFVKRVPVTNIEYEHMFSTKNLYDLPMYYNYGVGSAGFGVFRELVTHIKTTDWVLESAISTFPILYHYRLIPFSGERSNVNIEHHQRYVKYWDDNINIGRYLLDRSNANYEIVLFLEYIPYTVGAWLLEHPEKLEMVVADMHATITFLKENGIIHFDSHFFNMLTDGERSYLTDFDLALDQRFDLSKEERLFHRRHKDYDYGELLWNLGRQLLQIYHNLSDVEKSKIMQRFNVTLDADTEDPMIVLMNNIEEIYTEQIMPIDRTQAENIARYRDVITLMQDFYSNMRRNNKKNTRLDHVKLRRLLKETGFVPDTSAPDHCREVNAAVADMAPGH